jgi:hypothetical protein
VHRALPKPPIRPFRLERSADDEPKSRNPGPAGPKCFCPPVAFMSSFTGAAVQGGTGLSCPDGSGGAVETSNFGDDEAAIAGGLAACLTSRLIGQCQPGHRHVRESLRESTRFAEDLGRWPLA